MHTPLARIPALFCCIALSWIALACASPSLVEVPPANGITDPAAIATPGGAATLYPYVMARWSQVFGGKGNSTQTNLNVISGLMTDELQRVQNGFGISEFSFGVDERNDGSLAAFNGGLTNGNGAAINGIMLLDLERLRNDAFHARTALDAYGPATPLAWRARLAAAEGFTIVYLAELFCSGIPLSRTSITGQPDLLTRGFSTDELLTAAAALFDTAITLAGDSSRFIYLASVGKGRALLDLGRFADAMTAVATVPTDFIYPLEYNSSVTISNSNNQVNLIGSTPQGVQVRDNEGMNGFVWSTDPRPAVVTTPSLSGAMLVPGKYSVAANGAINATVTNPNASIRGADGLEARLIEAEAALALNDPSWLAKLNALRSTCVGAAACAPVPNVTSGALPPLVDPGTVNARLDLLMKERAMWLYLTGHRQGDMRRMAHVYHRDPMSLWPVGLYTNVGFPPLIQPTTTNGTVNYVNQFVITTYNPTTNRNEQDVNPLYSGCIDLNP